MDQNSKKGSEGALDEVIDEMMAEDEEEENENEVGMIDAGIGADDKSDGSCNNSSQNLIK